MTDKITSSGKLEKSQKEIQEAIGSNIQVELDMASIGQFPPDQVANAAEFFAGDGWFITAKNAFQSICKVGSGKAWLGRFSKMIVRAAPASPAQNTDTACQVFVQEPVMHVALFLRATRSLRSAYNASALESAIKAALPALTVGADMDKITASGKIEKTQKEISEALGEPVGFQVDLFSICNTMPPEDCAHASEYVSGDGLFITFKNAFQALCKVGSGKAWLQRFNQITVTFVSDHTLKTDSAYSVNAVEPMLQVIVSLKTTRSLRSAYNARGLEDAITAALPQLKTGEDMDKITASQKIPKTQKEIHDATGNSALILDVDLFAVSTMPNADDCTHAAEWIHGDGLFITFKNAFQALCKVGSGKAWLSRFQKIAIRIVANHDQKTDCDFTVQCVESLMNVTVSLKTTRSLRSAYNASALEAAITTALPQLKTGQYMDAITNSGKIDKTQKELQDATGNSGVVLECDLFSITNMAVDDCKNASEYVSGDGLFITFKNAFQALCKVGSGKAWLSRFQKVAVTFISDHNLKSDSDYSVTVQEPLMNVVVTLKTTRSLRSAYNASAFEAAITTAIPQLKTGQEIDKITSSQKIEKTQTEVRTAIGRQDLVLEVDLFSVANMPTYDDCKHAAEFFYGDGFFVTIKNGFASLAKKGNFSQFLSQFQKVHFVAVADQNQSSDLAVTVPSAANGVLSIQLGLKTNRSLRSAYNANAFEQAIIKAGNIQ